MNGVVGRSGKLGLDYFFFMINSNHSSNGVLNAVVCVQVVHSIIGVGVIKYNP